MLRMSSFMTLMRQSLQPCADAGKPLPAETVPILCDMLRLAASQCEEMENRLAGKAQQPIVEGNVVSLAGWAARNGDLPSVGGDPA